MPEYRGEALGSVPNMHKPWPRGSLKAFVQIINRCLFLRTPHPPVRTLS